jgi:hypothetical protein
MLALMVKVLDLSTYLRVTWVHHLLHGGGLVFAVCVLRVPAVQYQLVLSEGELKLQTFSML